MGHMVRSDAGTAGVSLLYFTTQISEKYSAVMYCLLASLQHQDSCWLKDEPSGHQGSWICIQYIQNIAEQFHIVYVHLLQPQVLGLEQHAAVPS